MTGALFDLPATRTPLRWPGGKSKGARAIVKRIPGDADVLAPFVGGASVEIALAARGQDVLAFDADPLVVNLWKHVLADAPALARRVRALLPPGRPDEKEVFERCKGALHEVESDFDRAAWTYIVNRLAFSGVLRNAGYSGTRYTERNLDTLADFASTFTVEVGDFRDTIPAHGDRFVYADPPYKLGIGRNTLYAGHADFDHEALARILLDRDRWALSYNDCVWAHRTYAACRIETVAWAYGMSEDKTGGELLITPH